MVNLDADRCLTNPIAHGSLTTKDCGIVDDLWTHVECPKLPTLARCSRH